jgi:hypothetical protein
MFPSGSGRPEPEKQEDSGLRINGCHNPLAYSGKSGWKKKVLMTTACIVHPVGAVSA